LTGAGAGRNTMTIIPQFPHFSDAFPQELKQEPTWVVCDPEKVPMVALINRERRASSTDPQTWSPYERALRAFQTGRYAGIGRVITPPYVGVDLDDVRDPETGAITDAALDIIRYFDSYSEVSPSKTGVKLWIRATLPRGYVRPGLEVYPSGRYFTVTGLLLTQVSAAIEPRQDELDAFISKEFPPPKKPPVRVGRGIGIKVPDLEEVLDRGGVEVLAEVHDNTAETKYRILCPWIDEHTHAPDTGTYVGQYDEGALFFHCWHSHCVDRGWRAFIEKVLPKPPGMRRFAKTYDSGKAVISLD
jgi:hypothetical protein